MNKETVTSAPGLPIKQVSLFMSDETRTVLQNVDIIESSDSLISFRKVTTDGRVKLTSFGVTNLIRCEIEL